MFSEGVDGSRYGTFRFSPIYNSKQEKVIGVEIESEGFSSDCETVYESTALIKEDVERLISYLQKQLEYM
jgi:hypothetical protein